MPVHIEEITGDKPTLDGFPGTAHLMLALDRILDEVQIAGERSKEKEHQDAVADQWHMVAAVYDRILFVAFFIGILVITVWFLTIELMRNK